MTFPRLLTAVFLLLLVPLQAEPSYELSYLVMRAGTGEIMVQQEASKLRTPASTMKLVTAAAALELLGPTHRYSTSVWATRPIQQGRLRGDLSLRGEADPELTVAALEKLAAELRKTGLRQVSGDLIVDEGEFAWPPYGPGWAWDDAGTTYSPEVTGLALNRGVVALEADFRAPWLHREKAPTNSVTLIPGQAGVLVRGELPAFLAAPASAQRTGERFREILASHGIKLRGAVRLGRSDGAMLAQHRSAPLEEILGRAMASSDNLALELIHRSTGGMLPRALSQETLRRADGSGLSRYNLISAAQLVAVLRDHPDLKPILPGSGQGTLRERFLSGPAAGQIRAKTGTLGNVSGLAGYLFPDSPQELIFAILINGHLESAGHRKALEDALVESWTLSRWRDLESDERHP